MTDYEKGILVADGCSHCAYAKELLKDKIEKGELKVYDIMKNDPVAMDIISKNHIKGVPMIILKDKVTQLTEICELSSDGRTALCKDKEVEI